MLEADLRWPTLTEWQERMVHRLNAFDEMLEALEAIQWAASANDGGHIDGAQRAMNNRTTSQTALSG